jgi:hypothetical protein
MDKTDAEFLISYFYVSKTLKKDPKKAIEYIEKNRAYFKFVTDEWLIQIKKEHGLE